MKYLFALLLIPLMGATLAPGTYTVPTCPAVSVPAATSWVYHNGQMLWPGDYSWNVTVNYADIKGIPPVGPADIAVAGSGGQWGGWLPYAPGKTISLKPFTSLVFMLKPTVAAQLTNMQVWFESANDTTDGGTVAVNKYCALTINAWASCTLPLSAFGLTDTNVLKFAVRDNSGGLNTTYLAEVGFH